MHRLIFPVFRLGEVADILCDGGGSWLSDLGHYFPILSKILHQFFYLCRLPWTDDAFEKNIQDNEEWGVKSEEYFFP